MKSMYRANVMKLSGLASGADLPLNECHTSA